MLKEDFIKHVKKELFPNVPIEYINFGLEFLLAQGYTMEQLESWIPEAKNEIYKKSTFKRMMVKARRELGKK